MVLVLAYFFLYLGVYFTSRFFVDGNARKTYQMICCFLLLFSFFGFRDITILNDTPHYYGAYYQLTKYDSYIDSSIFSYRMSLRMEWGYQVLMHFLIKYVSKDPYTIIMLSSLLFSWGNIWFLSKYTDEIALASFIMIISGIWIDQYSMIRQTIAIMLFYIAYGKLKKNQYAAYSGLILLGALFHTSALVLLLLPILKQLGIRWRNVAFVFLTALVASFFILQIIGSLGVGEQLYLKLQMKREAPPIAALLDGMLMLLLVMSCLFIHRRMGAGRLDRTDFWICVFGLCICIMTPFFLPMFRINAYIWPIVYIVFFRYFLNGEREGISFSAGVVGLKNCILFVYMLILLARIIVILQFKSEWNHLVPYSFYDFSDGYHYYHIYLQKEH